MMAVHSTPATAAGGSGPQQRGAAVASQTPIDSLPFLSRLARSASNLSASSTGSPAAGARGGAANLPPASCGQAPQQQLLHTPVFGSRRSSAGMAALPVSPGFGVSSGGGSAGLRARSAVAALPTGGGTAGRAGGGRRLSAPTGYSESGASDAAAPSFSMQAPSGLSSDEEDEVDSAAVGAASRCRRHSAAAALGVRPLAAAELALAEAAARLEQKQREAAQRKRKQQAAAAQAAQASGVRIAPSAAQWEKQCAEALAAAQAQVKPFVEDRAMRDKKRAIDKFVTLNVQQISATLEQIRLKAQALVGFMAAQHGAQRTYALLTLANKLISQCEVQVTRLNSFAFPLAEVAVAVMAAQPDFVPLLAARLHQVCPLTVPKYFVFRQGADEDAYLKQLGYKISTDEDTGQVTRESTDEFVGRMAGYLMLYAAALQSDNPQNPHGLQHAWTLLARLLNALPTNRITATAVDAVLKVAGFRMHLAYRGQFSKLLQYIDREFLPALGTSNDPDARAVYTRIQTFLRTSQFTKPPEGRDMPQFDASSYDRA
ncbi:hypothetical protein ABPG75_003599 [Micractinium tetrahymenae]